jgi:hypothetical protein
MSLEDLSESINPVSRALAILLFFLNIFAPGVGTMINACYSDNVN